MQRGRDAFPDGGDVPSILRAERPGVDPRPTSLTIAIPTFNRVDLLKEALASALHQPGAPAYEVIVVDNASEPSSVETAIAQLPEAPDVPVRYFVNAANIGMFANWNRCMTLARGSWMTILNDDDLLRPDFAARLMGIVARRQDVDALACDISILDRRPSHARGQEPGFGRTLRRTLWRRLIDARFDRDGLSRVTPRILYWGNEVGGGLGLLFRRASGIALGGYQPDEWPSADYYFATRYAIAHHLFLVRDTLAERGIGENESMRPEVLIGFAKRDMDLRAMLIEAGHVPPGWRRHSAAIAATFLANSSDFWHVRFDPDAIGRAFGALPPPSRVGLRLARLLRRAY